MVSLLAKLKIDYLSCILEVVLYYACSLTLSDAVCKSDTWEVLHSLTSHISSVRSVSVCPSQLQGEHSRASLMLTAGGRAQLCAWRVTCAVELSKFLYLWVYVENWLFLR